MRRLKRGLFIVLEGPDKAGKSTQALWLARRLRRRGLSVVHTREPGGTALAEKIRRLLLCPRHAVEPLAELFLYEASRAQHVGEKIRPALKRGAVVISERFTLATDVYQGLARGLGLTLTRRLSAAATDGLTPDLTIVLDVPESEFSSRKRRRAHDRMERASAAFRRRVREGYRRLSRAPRTVLLNGRLERRALHALIARRVEALL